MARNVLETRSSEVKSLSSEFQALLARGSRPGFSAIEQAKLFGALNQVVFDINHDLGVLTNAVAPGLTKCSKCGHFYMINKANPGDARMNNAKSLSDQFQSMLEYYGRLMVTEEGQNSFLDKIKRAVSNAKQSLSNDAGGCAAGTEKCSVCGYCVPLGRFCHPT